MSASLETMVQADAGCKGPPTLRGGPSVNLPIERWNAGMQGDEANTPAIGAGTPVLVLAEQWIPHHRSLTVLFQHVIESLDCDGLQRCIPFQGQHSQRL